MTNRDSKLDSLKGFLIILVVLGHLIPNNDSLYVNECLKTFIYTFHMPLFVFLSGYFTKINRNFFNGILNIFVPLCIFQSIYLIINLAHHENFVYTQIITPYWTLWYLLSLIFWKIILRYSPKNLQNKPILYLIIAFTLSILCGFIPYGRILSIQRTINFFPFFLLGYYIKQQKITIPNYLKNKLISIGIIIIIILLIIFNQFPTNNMLLLKGADSYTFHDIPAKLFLLICSVGASISFYNLSKTNNILTHFGQNSFIYYIYHGLIIEFAINPIISIFNLPQTTPFLLVYCLIIITTIYIMSKLSLFRFLIAPFHFK